MNYFVITKCIDYKTFNEIKRMTVAKEKRKNRIDMNLERSLALIKYGNWNHFF